MADAARRREGSDPGEDGDAPVGPGHLEQMLERPPMPDAA